MKNADERFEAFPDLSNNWLVWDCHADDFAEVNSERMSALTENRAKSVCNALNTLLAH